MQIIGKQIGIHLRFVRFSIFFILLLAACAIHCPGQPANTASHKATITINNIEPRRDVNRQIVDAHSGCLQFFNGLYYLYGRAFGTNLDGSTATMPFVVYVSPDLNEWTFKGNLFAKQPQGLYTRPYVVFNPTTKKYVLWYNWFEKLWHGQVGIAISDNPTGPFVIVNGKANLIGKSPGDCSLFVDDDGTGYCIYTDMADGYAVQVERLTPDFLSSTGETSSIMAKGVEAPVLFRRGNIYYALCGPLCNDAAKGSDVQVFTARSALGPFATQFFANINRKWDATASPPPPLATTPTGRLNTNALLEGVRGNSLVVSSSASIPTIPAQQTWVAKIPIAGVPMYIWIGDLWGSAPDGIKGHDLQFWSSPLAFSNDGEILPMRYFANWSITVTSKN